MTPTVPEPDNNLRAIMSVAGVEPEQLAMDVGVDAKTVERWLAGRVPYGRHRRTVARALNSTEHDLWPDAAPPRAPTRPQTQTDTGARPGDVLSSYGYADHPDAPDPVALITAAAHQIDLLDQTLIQLLSRKGFVELLDAKAAAGCQIRIFILDPALVEKVTRFTYEDRERPYWTDPAVLARLKAERAHGYIDDLLHHPNVHAYHHPMPGADTIIRVDDHMLIHLSMPWDDKPIPAMLHLHRREHGGLFDRYAEHFEQIRNHSSPELLPDPGTYPHPDEDPDRYLPLHP